MNDELEKFWRETRRELDRVPIDAKIEEAEEPKGFLLEGYRLAAQVHWVSLASFGGVRFRACYLRPLGRPPKHGWPAVMLTGSYTHHGITPMPLYFPTYGYAALAVWPRGEFVSEKEWTLEHSTRLTYNITDRDKYYYRGAFMDCVRAIDFLASQPEIDHDRIGAWGHSVGGGYTLATAALDHRLAAAVAGYPMPCNFSYSLEHTRKDIKVWKEIHNYLAENPRDHDRVMETLAFFNPASMARWIQCPTLVGGVVENEVHHLEAIQEAFDAIPAIKSFAVYRKMEELKQELVAHGRWWLDRYLMRVVQF